MKVKKSSFNAISKRIGCLFFALLMMISLAAPAFAAVNVEGEGGTSATVNGGGKETYNNADSMWKISKKSDVKCYEQDARHFYKLIFDCIKSH